MATEIRTFDHPKAMRDYWLTGPYRFMAELSLDVGKESWESAEGNIYTITKKNEYLFAEEFDEIRKALLDWDGRHFSIYWDETNNEVYGEEVEPGEWHVRADIPLPSDFINWVFPLHAVIYPSKDTPITEVEQIARENLFDDSFSSGVYILDREKSDDKKLIDEWIEELDFENLVKRASVIFGDKEKAMLWMKSPCPALGGKPPIDLAETVAGMELVSEVLARIECGLLA